MDLQFTHKSISRFTIMAGKRVKREIKKEEENGGDENKHH